MQTYDIKTISITDPLYPGIFTELKVVPAHFHVKGNVDLLSSSRPKLAVAGTRRATPYGKEVTAQLVRKLAASGAIIISGLAYGIDSIAHRAALEVGGDTIAVLPSGLDEISPRGNTGLAQSILDRNGMLLSEYGPHEIGRHNFVLRNRLVAALCDVLLVTEAAHKSGTFHTVTYARKLQKTIAAVPGNITSPMSQGVNQLFFDGAQPILDYKDLLSLLGLNEKFIKPKYVSENPVEACIVRLLEETSATTNALIERSNYNPGTLQAQLTMLEIKDVIELTASNKWRIKT